MSEGALQIGRFEVVTTHNGGHSPEFYAERLCDRIISVADSAPEPIRLQARVFRETLRELTLATVRSAMASERANVMAELNLKEI